MAPSKQWDDEESDSSSAPDSPPVGAVRRANKFEDEEEGDSDVLDSWDAADDSEVEREKAKKAAEAKAKADAEAAANKKPKLQRIAAHKADRRARAEADSDTDEEETEAERRQRLRRTEQESDLVHAADLFGDLGGVPNSRKATTKASAVIVDPSNPTSTVDLGKLPLFNPVTKSQFENLRETLAPMLAANNKKPHYVLFLEEFTKALAKDLPSDQIKKISSKLTTLSNEKMKEEKAAEKGGKKSKAAKTKTSLVANRNNLTDTHTYEDAFGDDDFM